MARFFVIVTGDTYVSKNKFHDHIKELFKSYDKILVDNPTILKAEIKAKIEGAHKEKFSRCNPVRFDEYVYGNQLDHKLGVYGVSQLNFYKVEKEVNNG